MSTAALRLTSRNIGALVVSPDGQRVVGIISERDIVHGLTRKGPAVLDRAVAEVMSREVTTCEPSDHIQELMATMTRRRHRHVPVVDGGRLCGMVSIGDVVKHRLDEMELETNVLREGWIARR